MEKNTTTINDAARYMTTEQICDLYHINRMTVYRWMKAGRITPVRVGRRNLYDRAEVEALAKPANS